MTVLNTEESFASREESRSDNPNANKGGTTISTRVKKSPTAFRTISEVADELDVQQHVLRFWETKFSQVKPLKRGGGRRYYRPEDVELLKRIHHLLYTEGYTIKGVQKLLKGQGKHQIIEEAAAETEQKQEQQQQQQQQPSPVAAVVAQQPAPKPGLSSRQKAILESMLGDLKDLRDLIKGEDKS